jgi:hypothetical protein
MAVGRGRVDVVRLLLEKGAGEEKQDDHVSIAELDEKQYTRFIK